MTTDNERQTYHWPVERTFPYAFALVDAELWEFFIEHPQTSVFTIRRQAITTGSVRYKVQLTSRKEEGDVAIIYARAVSNYITQIQITPGARILEERRDEEFIWWDTWRSMFYMMAFKMNQQERTMQEALIAEEPLAFWNNEFLANQTIDTAFLDQLDAMRKMARAKPSKSLGRRRDAINDWAQAQIAGGRTMEDVRAEYFTKTRVNQDNPNEVKQAKDRFRKAISRTKRTE